MEIFKQLNKKGYKHYYDGTIEELDNMDKNNPDLHSEIMQVIMWLYEKYGIWINVNRWTNQLMDDELWENSFQGFVDGDAMDARYYKTPSEAYEAAIKYALKVYDIKLIYMEYTKAEK